MRKNPGTMAGVFVCPVDPAGEAVRATAVGRGLDGCLGRGGEGPIQAKTETTLPIAWPAATTLMMASRKTPKSALTLASQRQAQR